MPSLQGHSTAPSLCSAGVQQPCAMQPDSPKCSAMTLCSTPFCQADLQLRHSMHASLLLHAVDVPQPSAQAGSPTATASGWKVRFSRPCGVNWWWCPPGPRPWRRRRSCTNFLDSSCSSKGMSGLYSPGLMLTCKAGADVACTAVGQGGWALVTRTQPCYVHFYCGTSLKRLRSAVRVNLGSQNMV